MDRFRRGRTMADAIALFVLFDCFAGAVEKARSHRRQGDSESNGAEHHYGQRGLEEEHRYKRSHCNGTLNRSAHSPSGNSLQGDDHQGDDNGF
jgi:hypothetical protein